MGIFLVLGAEVLLFEAASLGVRMAFVALAAVLAVAFVALVAAHGRARERSKTTNGAMSIGTTTCSAGK